MDYEALGKVTVNGCAGIGVKENYISLFSVGQRVWIKKKARVGKIESVVIKRKARRTLGRVTYTGIEGQFFYTDTLNRIWREDELVSESESMNLISSHENKEAEQFRALYDGGACFPIKPEGCR